MEKNQENFSRWSLFKEFIGQRRADILLLVGVFLVALIGFGLGQLTAQKEMCEPLIIQDSPEIYQTLQSLPGAAQVAGGLMQDLQQAEDSKASGVPSLLGPGSLQQGMFVASKNSNKYHWPSCPFAQRIKLENRIWFNSEAQAQAAGYTRCSNFLELAPASYKP